MVSITVVDFSNNVDICRYDSDIIPRVGDSIQIGTGRPARLQVKDVGHLLDIHRYEVGCDRGYLCSIIVYVTSLSGCWEIRSYENY